MIKNRWSEVALSIDCRYMLLADFGRKPLQNPWVHQCLLRQDSSLRLPDQKFSNKLHKIFIFTGKYPLQTLWAWSSYFSFAIRSDSNHVSFKKFMTSRSTLYERIWGYSKYLHEHEHLLLLVLSREERIAEIELCEDAAHRPCINCWWICHS